MKSNGCSSGPTIVLCFQPPIIVTSGHKGTTKLLCYRIQIADKNSCATPYTGALALHKLGKHNYMLIHPSQLIRWVGLHNTQHKQQTTAYICKHKITIEYLLSGHHAARKNYRWLVLQYHYYSLCMCICICIIPPFPTYFAAKCTNTQYINPLCIRHDGESYC